MSRRDSGVLLTIRDLSVAYRLRDGSALTVLAGADLSVTAGSFVTLLGPSGCGKTTLLNVVGGILRPSSGQLLDETGAARRPQSAYVFQSPRLLNWMTVRENLEFVLRARKFDRNTWNRRTGDTLELVGLAPFADEYPLSLSGGMQQRVGIARALVVEPQLLLMDEPFSHLDDITAKKLRAETARICEEAGVTVILVTHDMLEAAYFSDVVHIMLPKPSRIVTSVEVDLPRPRDFRDERIYRIESQIAADFFDHVDVQEAEAAETLEAVS